MIVDEAIDNDAPVRTLTEPETWALLACGLALTESIGTWTHKELDTSENLLYSLYIQNNLIG